MQHTMTQPAVVVLAAGQSSRLGTPKQLLRFNGKSLLQHSVQEALRTELPVIVITGSNSDLIKDDLKGFNITIVENKRWEEGMSTSIHCGLIALRNLNHDIDGIIFMVSDQPFVSATLLTNLLRAQNESGLPLAASRYAGRLGTPVLFHKNFFDALMDLQGDTGARKLIEKNKNLATEVSFPEGVIDIDTVEDYNALLHNTQD